MPHPPKLIVFDLDGTLIDTMGSFADLAGDLISTNFEWSFEKARSRYLETSGLPFFQQMEILFPADSRNKGVVDLFEKGKIGAFLSETISERTRETLHTLRDREVHTAISSNNSHDLVREFVHRENIPVHVALGFRDGFSKGAHHFDYLRSYLNIPFPSMAFVGDSLMDAQKAREREVRFVAKIGIFSTEEFASAVTWQPLLSVTEIHEILTVLELE